MLDAGPGSSFRLIEDVDDTGAAEALAEEDEPTKALLFCFRVI